ncbi:unnamed protein product [Ilex paraguariensis]|uniref:Uncharacterized protein n=1 Tax=Ilex paraguariensis TaxID=185542 RepID=A0ABC8SUC1_9AQUA
MGMGTLNKSVGAILGVKQFKHVKQPAAVPQVVGSQARTSQVGFDAGTSKGEQTLQQMVEKLEAQFEKFEDEMKGSLQRLESKLDCFYKDFKEISLDWLLQAKGDLWFMTKGKELDDGGEVRMLDGKLGS